tara:strand:+ start:12 stop:515 length:504 start_codon:yes stop_codon:yes gene_type:complete
MANLDRQTYKSSWNPNVAEIVLKYDDAGPSIAAGTYTGSVTVPAGAYITDIQVQSVLQWNAGTDAKLNVGDEADPDGYFNDTSMQSVLTSSLHASILTCGAGAAGKGVPGVYVMDTNNTGDGAYSATPRKVIASITTTGDVPTQGETRIVVIWVKPTDSVTSTFVAT